MSRLGDLRSEMFLLLQYDVFPHERAGQILCETVEYLTGWIGADASRRDYDAVSSDQKNARMVVEFYRAAQEARDG